MKNKEIEELLNKLKSVYELNKPLTDKYKEDCMRFVINTKEAELLLSYIEQLQSLCNKYEQEHKTTFEIWKKDIEKLKQLENNRDKAIEYIEKAILDNRINEVNWDYDECYFSDMPAERIKPLIDILKGDSDYD